MKKYLFVTAALIMSLMGVNAQPNFVAGKKYTIQCLYYNSGSLSLGQYHGVTPIVYYSTASNIPDDGYWYIVEDANGYFTIQNAKSLEYLVYDSERVETQKKGLSLSASASNNSAKWLIQPLEAGGFFIENVDVYQQYFNVRVDGTYLVGTYRSYNSSNSTFNFYDEEGNMLQDAGSSNEQFPQELLGVTDDGYYWERTGKVSVPVVASTASDPVLYKIRNVRTGKFLINSNNQLLQTDGEGDDFYFRKNNDGYSVCTTDGLYVLTGYPTDNQPLDIKKKYSILGTNYWAFNYYDDYDCAGYTLEKLTDRPTYEDSYYPWEEPQVTNGQSKYLFWNDCAGEFICLYDMYDKGSTFVFYSSDTRHAKYLMENGVVFPGVELMGFRSFVDTLLINEKELIYDKTDATYLATVPSEVRTTGVYTAKVHFVSKDNGGEYEMRIDGVAPNAEGVVELTEFDCNASHTLNLYKNGVEIESAPIRFTYLNIVEVEVHYCNSSKYTTGVMRVTQANVPGYDSIYFAAFKYRGASAQGYEKKSYAIKMREADGVTSKDVEFFGLRSDNNWILDAMAVDQACMRNRVSTDLWNDFATPPYHKREGFEKKARHGTRGEFAEVYLNGKYHGLYCFTEKMDRKQLKLKKLEEATATKAPVIHGTLYKSSQWSYEVLMGHEMGVNYYTMEPPRSYDNSVRSETWANYEIKYPDWEEEPIDWGPLWNAVNFVATTVDGKFNANFNQYFDYDNVTDYFLFIELMLATDNHGKNMFFYNYDQQLEDKMLCNRIGLAPWDLDGTWGRRWDGSSNICKPNQDFTEFLWDYEHGTLTLFHRLKRISAFGWKAELAARYAELRETYFSEESLCNRFQEYADLFSASGATTREENRWQKYHPDILEDVAYIKQWIEERLKYLDKQYGYVKVDAIDRVDTNQLTIYAGEGSITLSSDVPQTIKLYTIGGQLCRVVEIAEGYTQIDGLSRGIYLVNGKKVLVK